MSRGLASDDQATPELRMSSEAYRHIMCDICARPPESGGVLLGPIGSTEITDFYFDAGAMSTTSTYTPDHITLGRLMKERWTPAGIDLKGFAHSHPGCFDTLSQGDLAYIRRLLAANDDMDVFAAPIVIPAQYRFCPFVVLRQAVDHPRRASLILF